MAITRKKLERFVTIRNKASFNNNLQFQVDLITAGLTIDDLGDVTKLGDNHYSWTTPVGTLVEQCGSLRIEEAADA